MKKMIGPDEALDMVLASTARLAPAQVGIEEALGLTLAGEVRADRPYPPFSRVMMDGYAVCLEDAGHAVNLVGEASAGKSSMAVVSRGCTVRVMTGAPCPGGAEAVVPVEEAHLNGNQLSLPDKIKAGQHIAPPGSECQSGAVVAGQGSEVTPLLVANLAAYGYGKVEVIPPPACAIVTTGDEIVPQGAVPEAFQIRNSNAPMLAAQLRAVGVSKILREHAADNMGRLQAALRSTETADVVIMAGGVSMGKYDLVPDALRECGVDIQFHKVAQKPGKPLLFGTKDRRLFFGLPGNPLACHLCFQRYIAPAIRLMMGRPAASQPVRGRLGASLAANGPRTLFQLCLTEWRGDDWSVMPLFGAGSADIHSVASANSCLRVGPGSPPIPCGTGVEVQWLGNPS